MESGEESSAQAPGPERWPQWGWGLGLTLAGTLWLPLVTLSLDSDDIIAGFVGAAVGILVAAPILMTWRLRSQRDSPLPSALRVLLSPPLARRIWTALACWLLLAGLTFAVGALTHGALAE